MIVLEAIVPWIVQALTYSPLLVGERLLNGAADLFGGIVLFVIGIAVIVLVVAAAIVLLPAIIVGAIIWFLTGSFLYAGIGFLVVAVLSIAVVADD